MSDLHVGTTAELDRAALVVAGAKCVPGLAAEAHTARNFLREPANAVSDLSYLALSLYILTAGARDLAAARHADKIAAAAGGAPGSTSNGVDNKASGGKTPPPPPPPMRNLFGAHPSLSILYGLANLHHFCGTFTNHACRCHTGHVWDAAGMYGVVFFLALYGFARLCHTTTGRFPPVGAMWVTFICAERILWSWADGVYYGKEGDADHDKCEKRETLTMVALILLATGLFFGNAYRRGRVRLVRHVGQRRARRKAPGGIRRETCGVARTQKIK